MKLKSQVSRAQLLRAWKEQTDAGLRVELAELFGYEPSSDYLRSLHNPDDNEAFLAPNKDNLDEGAEFGEPHLLNPPEPRPQVSYYYLAKRERYATEDQAKQEIPPIFEGIDAISDEALKSYWSDEPQKPLKVSPLTQARTMTPFVRKSLRQEVGRKLDVKTLVRQIAKQKPLKILPTEPRLLPAGRVTVIADLNDRLLPFWDDIREACELIKQKHGKVGLDMRVLARDQPLDDYYIYDDWAQRKLSAQPWQKISAQSMVFILSDLGQLAEQNSLIRQRWLQFIIALNRRGITPIVLAPIASAKQCPKLQARTQLILWQRFGQLNTQQARGDKAQHQQQVEKILAYLSLSPHIEPALLRAFCELLARQDGQSGIEADVYLHLDVQWGYTAISLRTERREYHQQQFEKEPQHVKQQVLDCIGQYHSSQFAAVWAESILNAEKLMTVDKSRVEKAEKLMLQLTLGVKDNPAHDGMKRFARRHLSRLNVQQHQQKDYLPAMYALANREGIQQGEAIPDIYAGKTDIINQVVRQVAEQQQYVLQQVGSSLFIAQQAQGSGQSLAEFTVVQKNLQINTRQQNLPDGETLAPVELTNQEKANPSLFLDTGQEQLTIRSLQKPSWASEITMRDGVPIATLIFAGKPYQLKPKWHNEQLIWQPVQETQIVGFDEYGLFAEISVKEATQRLRYIEPTTFWMGSPEDEKGRYEKNEQQHQVTLTQGYWLADTACTQAFWQVVTAENPSDFKDDKQNPVENVSWVDTQGFIGKLKQLSPNLQIHLPTEAQWENACRAGTTAPFNFDGDADLQKLNYSGIWGEKGWDDKALQKTAQVKNYPANDWGLYEMHGNVWEWCFDEWQESLGSDPTIDPVTAQFKSKAKSITNIFPSAVAQTETVETDSTERKISPYDSALLTNADKGDVERVLRGGSWNDFGRNCRSAVRSRLDASDRLRYVGFRFAVGLELPNSAGLRSNTASKTGMSNEQTEQDTARSGAAQGVDQAGSGGKQITQDINALLESNRFQQSLRSDDGWKVDSNLDEPLFDKAKELFKGLFGRKKNEEDKK